MKLKNISSNIKEIFPYIVGSSVVIATLTGTICYYSYERITQVEQNNLDMDDMDIDENGNIYYSFDVGEHKVTVSSNDFLYRQRDTIDGYTIENVEINGWRDNNQVTYVNQVPVIVKATSVKDGVVEFADFGEIETQEKVDSLKK